MKTTLMFTLPFPPSVNTYYRTYLGRMLISRKGREYRRAVLAEIIRQKVTQGLGDARLALTIGCHRGDRRKYDLDNLLKGLLDAMQHAGLFDDDGQIDDLMIVRSDVDRDQPRVSIQLTAITSNERPASALSHP